VSGGTCHAGQDHHRVRQPALSVDNDRLVGQLESAHVLIYRDANRRHPFRGGRDGSRNRAVLSLG
jgi:hypothetical protein